MTGLGSPLANKVVADLVTPPSSASSTVAAKPAVTASSVRALLSSGSGMDTVGLAGVEEVGFSFASTSTGGSTAVVSLAGQPNVSLASVSIGAWASNGDRAEADANHLNADWTDTWETADDSGNLVANQEANPSGVSQVAGVPAAPQQMWRDKVRPTDSAGAASVDA